MPITLQRYAALRACIDRGEPRAPLLQQAGLDEAGWRAAQRGWLAQLGQEAQRRRTVLAEQYQQAYLAQRPELLPPEAAAVELKGITPILSAPDAAADESRAPAASAPAPIDEIGGTNLGVYLDLGDALPFAEDELVEQSAAEQSADAEQSTTAKRSTTNTAAEQNAATEQDEDALGNSLSGATQMVTALSDADLAALPFEEDSADPAPHPPAQHAPAPAAVAIDQTGELRLDLSESLPFDNEGSAPTPIADELSVLPAGDMDGTALGIAVDPDLAALPFDDAPAPTSGPASTSAAAPPPSVNLTLEQYASLCAECRHHPQQYDAINLKYGFIDRQARAALDHQFRTQFAADHAQGQRFSVLVEQYLTWLQQKAH